MPFQLTQRKVKDVLADRKIDIPVHQRPYIWTKKQAVPFIDTIMDGMPAPALFVYEEIVGGEVKRWLEDGQQRYMTIKKFVNGEFEDSVKWRNKTYAEFSADEKSTFDNYELAINIMEDIPLERRLALFQRLQDGVPLTNGQRFHACSHMPLVGFAREIMNNPECTATWADRSKDNASKTGLANAMAIASGCALHNDDLIVSSYNILGPDLGNTIDLDEARARLQKLLSVYSRADEITPTNATKKRSQWSVGTYTGYILYAMNQTGRDWEGDKEMIAQYIARVRRENTAALILKWKKPASRNWTSERWSQGLWNLENQTYVETKLADGMSETASYDSDDE